MTDDFGSHESEHQSTDAAIAARIVDGIRHAFGSSWRQDDNFLEKFFPVCPTWKPHIEAAQKRNYNMKTSRWKHIARTPSSASKLYSPLRMLMNDILLAEEESREHPSSQQKGIGQKKAGRKSSYRYEEWWRTKHVRGVLATHAKNKRVYTQPQSPISPTLYLAGGGSQIMGVGTPLIQANSLAGIAPIEVILDSDDSLLARDRLATNVSQMFCNQSSRRFAFGLIMTETTCTVYVFDHSGGVASQPFNYHQQPVQFCAIIFRLGCDQCDRLGFDPSVFFDGTRGGLVVRTLVGSRESPAKQVCYILDRDGELFHFPTLIGRGTVCWRSSKEGHPGSRFVIKEAWISCDELPGRESEGSLLRHAQAKGVVSGVPQLEHFEEVQLSDGSGDLDTVLCNRQVNNPTAEDLKLDRVHTRIVLKTYGKPLNGFDTRRELLLAFHDAVLAHKELYQVAGILHRDISMGNILINPGGAEGNRGILIDFDHAIRVGDNSQYSTKKRIGTWRYMSRNVLEGKNPHIYLDDLESFYFVLCWILMVYCGPHKARVRPPRQASCWDELESYVSKAGGLIKGYFNLPVDPWFGPCFEVLANRLYAFFHIRCSMYGDRVPPVDPHKDYDEYLGHIQQCTLDMEAEDLAAKQHISSPSGEIGRTNLSFDYISGKRSTEEATDRGVTQIS